MATSFNVNLQITSAVGFRKPDYAITAPRPVMTTTWTLNGDIHPEIFTNTKFISMSTPDVYTLYPDSTSTAQVISISNQSNSTVTMVLPYFRSSLNGVVPVVKVDPSSALYTGSMLIPPKLAPNTTGTFTLAYYALEQGDYYNWLIAVTDSDSPQYKIVTRQLVYDSFDYDLQPNTISTSSAVTGYVYNNTVEVIPILNGIEQPDVSLSYTASVGGSNGWYINTQTGNTIEIGFKSNYVNNVPGVWNDTLTVNSINTSKSVALSFNIGSNTDGNLSYWISPAAYNNSVVGVSLDQINNITTITIGVGMGGDSSPVCANGGTAFIDSDALGIIGGSLDTPYPYWSTVYRIPLTGPGTYYSGSLSADGIPAYRVKTTEGLNYADYFGFEQGEGSIFVVEYDGAGNVIVNLNNLRELSSDPAFNDTLENLTRSFHYYSAVDNVTRYYQLETTDPADPRTHLFRGFIANYSTPSPTWSVDVTLVPLPT
jgi:hypothetical protein